MRSAWSKLLNQQDNILVLTSRGKVTGLYIPFKLAKALPNKYKVLFLYLIDAYAKKAVPELEEVGETAKRLRTRSLKSGSQSADLGRD